LTFAPGADVLPVFNSDCSKLMWTAARGGNPAPQLFIADFVRP
jgi:TolB protein